MDAATSFIPGLLFSANCPRACPEPIDSSLTSSRPENDAPFPSEANSRGRKRIVMKPSEEQGPTDPTPAVPSADEATTGLPGFRTWKRVYLFVLGAFVFYVVILAVFTAIFS